MLGAGQVEQLICLVAAMDRQQLAQQFATYQANFPVDFSQDFLNSTPLEQLQHIFVAMCIQSQRLPNLPAPHAA